MHRQLNEKRREMELRVCVKKVILILGSKCEQTSKKQENCKYYFVINTQFDRHSYTYSEFLEGTKIEKPRAQKEKKKMMKKTENTRKHYFTDM